MKKNLILLALVCLISPILSVKAECTIRIEDDLGPRYSVRDHVKVIKDLKRYLRDAGISVEKENASMILTLSSGVHTNDQWNIDHSKFIILLSHKGIEGSSKKGFATSFANRTHIFGIREATPSFDRILPYLEEVLLKADCI